MGMLVLLVLFLLNLCCVCDVYGVDSASGQYVTRLSSDFELCTTQGAYTNHVNQGGFSQISEDSLVRVVSGDHSITGDKSLQINRCDIRWQDMHLEDKGFMISFSLKIDRSFDQTIQLMLSTQDTLTELDSEESVFLTVKNDASGSTILQGSDMTFLTELKKDTVYLIELTMDRGSNVVRVSVNRQALSKTYRFISPIYFIDGLRLVSDAEEETLIGGFLTVDDISIATKGRVFAQTYSVQMPGDTQTVKLPEIITTDTLRVFINGIQIGMSKSYVSSQTVYISAEQFFKSIDVPYKYDKDQKLLTVKNDRVSVRVSVPSDEAEINGNVVKLKHSVLMIDSVIMISPNFINEVFNAKVWWDRDANMLVVTTGTQKNDGILRKVGTKLYMNGEPYYTVGYNCPELFQQVLAHSLESAGSTEIWLEEAEQLLEQLHAQDISSVRISCEASLLPNIIYDDVSMGKYLEAMDAFMDLCDRYQIRVVACLELMSPCLLYKEDIPRYGWITMDELPVDLVADSMSESRKRLEIFVEKFVSRYRTRNTILMYEISDAGNLQADTGDFDRQVSYSLAQLGAFYADCANLIRTYDTERLVGSGDAMLLLGQWHLYERTMAGDSEGTYTSISQDSPKERLKALWLLNESLDVISVQTNNTMGRNMDSFYMESTSQQMVYDYSYLIQEAQRLGKAFCNSAAQTSQSIRTTDSETAEALSLEDAVISGVQLSYWNYEDGGVTLDLLEQANQSLQTRYMVNMAGFENTDSVWNGSAIDVFDPENVISGAEASRESSTIDALLRFGLLSLILVVGSSLIILAFKNKKVA